MAQFDVYENINEKTKEQIPFLLDIVLCSFSKVMKSGVKPKTP